jgi:hypothetical protein
MLPERWAQVQNRFDMENGRSKEFPNNQSCQGGVQNSDRTNPQRSMDQTMMVLVAKILKKCTILNF